MQTEDRVRSHGSSDPIPSRRRRSLVMRVFPPSQSRTLVGLGSGEKSGVTSLGDLDASDCPTEFI